MASNFDDTSLWRLTTPGGIKYKFLGLTGSFDREDGAVLWSVVILSTDLLAFMQEIFPPENTTGTISVPQYFILPELQGLAAQKASFGPLDASVPSDPFSHDPEAIEGTYFPVVKVDVELSTVKGGDDPNDPITFLEISSTTAGEFGSKEATGAKWKESETATKTEENKSPNIKTSVLLPHTEWNVKWKQLDYNHFKDVVIGKLRLLLGKVNEATFNLLFDAPRGTILMVGFTYSQTNTWRLKEDGEVEIPPVTLGIRFLEKRILYDGIIRGHNDFWREKKGWQFFLPDGEKPTFEYADYNSLFIV